MYNRKNREETERVEKVVHDMVDRAIEMEGSCTVCSTRFHVGNETERMHANTVTG
jgi:hypothetical protein